MPLNGDLQQNGLCPDDLLCSASELLSHFKSLDPGKAGGPDGLSGRMLKGTANSIAP